MTILEFTNIQTAIKGAVCIALKNIFKVHNVIK